jgi:hypothetical protein
VGFYVTAEVFERSRQKGGKLLILLALAENAENEDGVVFGIDQGWPKKERNVRKQRKTIAGKARLNATTVSKLLAELAGPIDDELEVRWVQDGQSRTAVYRITVGRYRSRDVDYERLTKYQQCVGRPFSTPDELARPWAERPGNKLRSAEELPGEMPGSSEGDDLEFNEKPPGDLPGDHLASTRGDTNTPRGRVVQQQQVHEDHLDLELEETEETAAAETPLADAEVTEFVRSLRGSDASSVRTVLPLVEGLPRARFIAVAETVRARCQTGAVKNPCGLLVSLLKAERAEWVMEASAALAATITPARRVLYPWGSELLRRDAPDRYVRLLAAALDDVAITDALSVYHQPARIAELLELAARVRAGDEPAAEPETPEQARTRWIDGKARDLDFPLDEIHAVVEAWDDVDDIERQTHLDRAEATRAAAVAQREAAA